MVVVVVVMMMMLRKGDSHMKSTVQYVLIA
jgi:hypothetical protein